MSAQHLKHKVRRALRAAWGRALWVRDSALGPPRAPRPWTILAGHDVGSGRAHLGGEMRVSIVALEGLLDWLAARASILPVGAALRAMARGESGPPLVSLSFDDGYRGVGEHLAPILRRRGLRASLYAHTGTWGDDWLPWTDHLLLLVQRRGPAWMERRLAGPLDLPPGDGSLPGLVSRLKQHRDIAGRDALLGDLFAVEIGDTPRWCREIYLRPQELRELEDVLEIGSHGVRHARLASCTREELRRELLDSREQLESVLGHAVESFAFPFGRAKDLPRRAAVELMRAGYTHGCTMVAGSQAGLFDPHLLRRWPLEERAARWELREVLYGRLRSRWLRP